MTNIKQIYYLEKVVMVKKPFGDGTYLKREKL